ncbi:polysaccharide deacetylase [Streptomyces sp. CNQ-509]|uniref:polysaccharide deacetylase family protein n=1 Tax=unclassified Streptomyces TaxID=2593676 RepID=UPI00062DDB7F|nr:polysaccharide deacetylase family protein [Streptomyces sp. CNQ-509]AKH84339.1 polysaccharide deacetylase [Streptomyces sp. CNQ-509]
MRRTRRSGRRSSAAAIAAVCLLALTACADAARPTEEWFPQGAEESAAPGDGRADGKPGARHAGRTPRALPGGDGTARKDVPRATGPGAYRRWGLDRPLAAPPAPPASRPVRPGDSGLPAVAGRVPTRDKVVFLTIDDGWDKDPGFIRMAADLRLPFSMFLSDSAAGGDYGYFEELRRLGNSVHGHTLTHPDLTSLPYAGQRRQICRQQERVAGAFGVRPTLFRPPYGTYDAATLRAAASCGVRAMPLWRADMKASGLEYRSGDRLRPGDIVLAHFRGPEQQGGRTMTDVMAEFVREVQRQGFTVARLEDYM